VDVSKQRTFGFGNSSSDKCCSNVEVKFPVKSDLRKLGVNALDKGRGPILMSIKSLKAMGAIIDYGQNTAIFTKLDPRSLVHLETTASGHQVIPLAEEFIGKGEVLAKPVYSLKQVTE
jgi:hypothetical protein